MGRNTLPSDLHLAFDEVDTQFCVGGPQTLPPRADTPKRSPAPDITILWHMGSAKACAHSVTAGHLGGPGL